MAAGIRAHGAASGARPAGTAAVFRLAPALMEEGAHYQCHRTLFCGSTKKNPAHGLLRQRGQRGPHHLLHLPKIQPGMEKPHPQAFYTSRLTSPWARTDFDTRGESLLKLL